MMILGKIQQIFHFFYSFLTFYVLAEKNSPLKVVLLVFSLQGNYHFDIFTADTAWTSNSLLI